MGVRLTHVHSHKTPLSQLYLKVRRVQNSVSTPFGALDVWVELNAQRIAFRMCIDRIQGALQSKQLIAVARFRVFVFVN